VLLFVCIAISVVEAARYRPVVLMHGLGADASTMETIGDWIRYDYPGIYILNVEIGNGGKDSLEMNINHQIDLFAQAVQSDIHLKDGFNLIGWSQGGLVTRAYVERYNNPPVHNLISYAGPQDGVYGTPEINALCPDKSCPWLDEVMDLLLTGKSPTKLLQEHVSFAAYWKSPFDYEGYLLNNEFLADINNEKPTKNPTYKKNIISLNTYLLIYALEDTIVIPKNSPWFEFYALGQVSVTVALNQTQQYQEDWIGLKTLDKARKLILGSVPCKHEALGYSICKPYVYDTYTRALLNNTLNV